MTDMDRFKQDNLDLIEAVGLWPNQSALPMKRWSDEKACEEHGVLVFVEAANTYAWFEGLNLFQEYPRGDGIPMTLEQISRNLIEQGWMVA